MSLTPLVEVAIFLAVLYLFFSQIASGALELLAFDPTDIAGILFLF